MLLLATPLPHLRMHHTLRQRQAGLGTVPMRLVLLVPSM
jgi:hypothetical protein